MSKAQKRKKVKAIDLPPNTKICSSPPYNPHPTVSAFKEDIEGDTILPNEPANGSHHHNGNSHSQGLGKVASKARELKYKILEWILIKSIVFSLVIFLIIVILLHFVLNLAGGYLPVIVISVLTSIALRPTKDHFSSNIKKFLGIIQSQDQDRFIFQGSFLFFIYRVINDLIYYKQKTQLSSKRKAKIASTLKLFSPTGDIYAILVICGCWILVSKFGINFVLLIFGIILVMDFVVRLLLDSLTFLINQFSYLKDVKLQIQKNKDLNKAIDSAVGTSVLFIFLVASFGCLIFFIFYLIMDIETIVSNLRSSMTLLTQNINHKASEYFGVENAIDENFVVSFIKNYNESIYSYVENQDLKNIYILFSGALNSIKTNSTGSSLSDLPSLVENNSEFQECLAKNRLGFNISIARNLEAIYCTILPYASKLSLDPYTTLRKMKDSFAFVFQILFGTILVEAFVISKAAMDYVFQFLIFCFVVYYQINAKSSAIDTMTSMLPFSEKVKEEINEALVKSIKGSFLCSIKIFIFHFIFTWMVFDILQLKLGFTVAIAASIFSILPFIPTWVLCIPHAIYLYFEEDNLLLAILFPVTYVMISNKVYNDIYQKSINIHPYVTGLSIVLGVYAFDIQGIIYGPLLMCITLIVIELIKKYGLGTESLLQLYKKKLYLEQLESLEIVPDSSAATRRRFKSMESEMMTPRNTSIHKDLL